MSPVWGTPGSIADMMEQWVRQRACDGFNVMPTGVPVEPRGTEFVEELVIPELQPTAAAHGAGSTAPNTRARR